MAGGKHPHNHSVIASLGTMAKLGWVTAKMPEIAQADVLIITKEDLMHKAGEPRRSTPTSRLSKIFENAGIPPEQHKAMDMRGIVNHVMKREATASGHDFDGDGKADLGIITAPDLSMSPRQYVSMMTNIPEKFIKNNIPGTSRDYAAAIMFHESAHVPQPTGGHYRMNPLPYEIDADQKMHQALGASVQQGQIKDPAVSDMFKDMRRVAGLGQDSHFSMIRSAMDLKQDSGLSSHSTHLALDSAGFLPDAGKQHTESMLKANSVLSTMAGTFMLFEGVKEFQSSPKIPEHERIFKSPMDIADVQNNPLKLAELGKSQLASDPVFAYVTLQAARDKGFIKPGTPDAAYADKVTNFFEKHIDLEGADKGRLKSAKEFYSKIPMADETAPMLEQKNQMENAFRSAPPALNR